MYVILCVESRILNNDENMSGGHYIILEKFDNGGLLMHNPRKNKIVSEEISYEKAIDLCQNYGSWRILIEENKK